MVPLELQKSSCKTCRAINNVGCMHIFARPYEIKDLFSIAGIPDGFRPQYFYYVPDFVWLP
jgi:hypothetical protein